MTLTIPRETQNNIRISQNRTLNQSARCAVQTPFVPSNDPGGERSHDLRIKSPFSNQTPSCKLIRRAAFAFKWGNALLPTPTPLGASFPPKVTPSISGGEKGTNKPAVIAPALFGSRRPVRADCPDSCLVPRVCMGRGQCWRAAP